MVAYVYISSTHMNMNNNNNKNNFGWICWIKLHTISAADLDLQKKNMFKLIICEI